MSRIIYCTDLVLRVDDPDEHIGNITQWILESTEYRPAFPETCVLRQEVGTLGKLWVILVAWLALIVLTTFYCSFCEQRLFPRQRLLDLSPRDEDGQNGGWPRRFKWRRKGGRGLFGHRRDDWGDDGSPATSIFSAWISPSLKRSQRRLPSYNSNSSLMSYGGGGGGGGMGGYRPVPPSSPFQGDLKFREFRRLEDEGRGYDPMAGGGGGNFCNQN